MDDDLDEIHYLPMAAALFIRLQDSQRGHCFVKLMESHLFTWVLSPQVFGVIWSVILGCYELVAAVIGLFVC